MDEQISLDVHAISALQKRGLPPTDESSKHTYTATTDGVYGTLTTVINSRGNTQSGGVEMGVFN